MENYQIYFKLSLLFCFFSMELCRRSKIVTVHSVANSADKVSYK